MRACVTLNGGVMHQQNVSSCLLLSYIDLKCRTCYCHPDIIRVNLNKSEPYCRARVSDTLHEFDGSRSTSCVFKLIRAVISYALGLIRYFNTKGCLMEIKCLTY